MLLEGPVRIPPPSDTVLGPQSPSPTRDRFCSVTWSARQSLNRTLSKSVVTWWGNFAHHLGNICECLQTFLVGIAEVGGNFHWYQVCRCLGMLLNVPQPPEQPPSQRSLGPKCQHFRRPRLNQGPIFYLFQSRPFTISFTTDAQLLQMISYRHKTYC